MTMKALTRNNTIQRSGPLVLIIMDGIGISDQEEGNAFHLANTPVLDNLFQTCIHTTLKAHGTAVGLPGDGDMGNSEVGHNALGAGGVFDQGAKLANSAIESEKAFESDTWRELIKKPVKEGTTLHFIGLLSDGNVHSHIDHLFTMIDRSAKDGVKTLRVHVLLDGRDVPETSAPKYIKSLEDHLKKHTGDNLDYRIASGGGRMVTTMDRYEADWDIVKRGWEAHVLGKGRPFSSAIEALETYRSEKSGLSDQNVPSFTVTDNGRPVGPIEDGDSVLFFNFRGDRAIEISRAFDEENFSAFDRERAPAVVYAGMMEYDGDLKIPKHYLVQPPDIDNTVSEYLARTGVKQLAISETQKFGHVTYFWNGNNSEKFDDEKEIYVEIPSDRVEFNERPWMKAAEITDRVIREIEEGSCPFIRLNFANGDMVGHTGFLDAAIIAAETVDLCVGRIITAVREARGIAVITADHGNLDEMYESDKKTGEILIDGTSGKPNPKTSHTLNPVPFIIYDPDYNNEYRLSEPDYRPGLGNVASTLLLLMGFDPPGEYLEPVISLA